MPRCSDDKVFLPRMVQITYRNKLKQDCGSCLTEFMTSSKSMFHLITWQTSLSLLPFTYMCEWVIILPRFVWQCMCKSICLSVNAITPEPIKIET